MEIVRVLHSGVRWLVLLNAILILVYFALAFLQSRPWEKRSQTLLTIFSSLIGVQWVLGLMMLLWQGSQTGFGLRHYWEHLFWQTAALAVAHLHFRWRRQSLADRVRYRNGLVLVVAVFALIVIGILVLPQGIQWRVYTGA
jgi:hypothetical protein